jgi:hypothetical protein
MQREQILGAWQLASWSAVDVATGERSYPFGPDAMGLIMYTTDGYMSAQIMVPGRADYDVADFAGGTQQQAAAAASGYMAYSGPYEVDEKAGVVRHHLELSLMPNWLNTVQVRDGVISGDRLTLSADLEVPGRERRAVLEWIRIPGRTLPAEG